MTKYKNFISDIARLIETGLVSSKDIKKEIENIIKFRTEGMINKLNLVSREDFEVQKKLVDKLLKEIKKINSKKRKK